MKKNAVRAVRVVIALNIGAVCMANAQTPVQFEHSDKDQRKQQSIDVEPGDRIEVVINNTCPDLFDYQYVAFTRSENESTPKGGPTADIATCAEADAKKALKEAGFCERKSSALSFVHDRTASSYQIIVGKKAGVAVARGLTKKDFDAAITAMTQQPKCDVPKDLAGKSIALAEQASYLIQVTSSPWALGMSGGLTISDVVDPRFAVVNDPASTATPPTTIVVRDRGAEDSQKLGFAGFLHVHNENWKVLDMPIAPTFGLGIQDQNSISGFVGASLAAFDMAYLTFGWNWSSVERLPTGQRLGAAPISDNVLNDLPSRTDNGWFIGFSFKLMSPGADFFKKKVAVTPPVTEETPPKQ